LLSEGFRKDHVFVTGSPLFEVLNNFKSKIGNSRILANLNLEMGKYFVVSAHREENIDLGDNFNILVNSINVVAETYKLPIIFSTHPRTKNKISNNNINFNPLVKILEPLGFFDYINLQKNAFCVLSDSGTISEESAMIGFRAVSIRTSTERPEAIDAGSIVLGGINSRDILNSIEISINTFDAPNLTLPNEYKVNDVSQRVIKVIQSYTSIVNRVIWDK
jgi:UDP-N-acetylglucosamine 2-epimerase (non-hydrolysing)